MKRFAGAAFLSDTYHALGNEHAWFPHWKRAGAVTGPQKIVGHTEDLRARPGYPHKEDHSEGALLQISACLRQGKSIETAFQEVIRTVDRSLYYKQYTAAGFLHIVRSLQHC